MNTLYLFGFLSQKLNSLCFDMLKLIFDTIETKEWKRNLKKCSKIIDNLNFAYIPWWFISWQRSKIRLQKCQLLCGKRIHGLLYVYSLAVIKISWIHIFWFSNCCKYVHYIFTFLLFFSTFNKYSWFSFYTFFSSTYISISV